MNSKLIICVAALTLAGSISAGAQQRGPKNPPYDLWCRDQPVSHATSAQICMAYTYEQCMASRASQTESCYLNPRHDPRFRRN